MNLDELRSVRRTERQKDSLQHLRDSFYEDVAEYVAALKSQRQEAATAATDPFSDPEVGRLTDEIETAEDIAEAIYERRVGKVVKLASFEAADMATETDGLTAEERALFDDLVARIRDNRALVLDTLAGSPPADAAGSSSETTERADRAAADSTPDANAAPAPDPPSSDPADPEDVLAEAMGGAGPSHTTPAAGDDPSPGTEDDQPSAAGDDPSPARDADGTTSPSTRDAGGATPPDGAPGTASTDTERTTLRITRDVGEILGVDEREYDLARDDVVRLPAANAEPLLERDAAERLE